MIDAAFSTRRIENVTLAWGHNVHTRSRDKGTIYGRYFIDFLVCAVVLGGRVVKAISFRLKIFRFIYAELRCSAYIFCSTARAESTAL